MNLEQFGRLTGGTIARLAKHVERALDQFGLTLAQYRLLVLLSDGAAMSSVLADRLAVTPPSITSVVDTLVGRGLVERLTDPDDRRRLPLALTDDGAALVGQVDIAVGRHLLEISLESSGTSTDDVTHATVMGLAEWQVALDEHRRRLTAVIVDR